MMAHARCNARARQNSQAAIPGHEQSAPTVPSRSHVRHIGDRAMVGRRVRGDAHRERQESRDGRMRRDRRTAGTPDTRVRAAWLWLRSVRTAAESDVRRGVRSKDLEVCTTSPDLCWISGAKLSTCADHVANPGVAPRFPASASVMPLLPRATIWCASNACGAVRCRLSAVQSPRFT